MDIAALIVRCDAKLANAKANFIIGGESDPAALLADMANDIADTLQGSDDGSAEKPPADSAP